MQAFSDGLVDWSVAFLPPQNLKRIDDLSSPSKFNRFLTISAPKEAYRIAARRPSLLILWEELRSESHQFSQLLPNSDLERPPRENYPGQHDRIIPSWLMQATLWGRLTELNMAIIKG